jgi:hypothetical protein
MLRHSLHMITQSLFDGLLFAAFFFLGGEVRMNVFTASS